MQLITRQNITFPEVAGSVERIDYRSAVDGHVDFACIRPGRTQDWAVVLHGHGSHGDQLFTRPDIRNGWLPELERAGVGILAPNLRDNAWMSRAAIADLHDLLGWLRMNYPVRRLLFTSGSMGGTGNLIYALQYPEDVGALVARGAATDLAHYHGWLRQIGGAIQQEIADALEASLGGTPEQAPEAYRAHSALYHPERLTMPVYLLHGEADTLMPVEDMRRLALVLAASGKKEVHYREIPGGTHDAPLLEPVAFDYEAWQ